jgi:glycosyltransferase involved in cell wall biosynthesis
VAPRELAADAERTPPPRKPARASEIRKAVMYPKISVVVPSCNRGRYLEQTLCSVIDQRYPNLELIVIDGASTDDSVDVIRKYEPHITYWISEPDGGRTRSLIKGFSRATGQIACWLKADDMHEPETLRHVADYFSAHPDARFVYGNCTWIGRFGEILYYRREMAFYRWLWLYAYNYIPQPAAFWRRDLYDDVGGLDTNYRFAMDADLFARYARVCEPQHLDEPLARARYYEDKHSLALRMQCEAEQHEILCREMNRNVGTVEKSLMGSLARAVRFSFRTLPSGGAFQ